LPGGRLDAPTQSTYFAPGPKLYAFAADGRQLWTYTFGTSAKPQEPGRLVH